MVEKLKSGNGGKKEQLPQLSVKVRFADLEGDTDVAAVAKLFNQQASIEHLAGIAPEETPSDVDVKKYGIINPNFNIIIATKEEIERYYKDRPGIKLIVATDVNSRIVGTVTIELPSMGLTSASVSRMVVSEDVRGEGVGKKLLKAANAYIFSKPEKGGLGCTAAQAGVIMITGQEIPLGIFGSEGYRQITELKNNCVSWSFEKKKFVPRSVLLVRLEPKDFKSKIDPDDSPKTPQN